MADVVCFGDLLIDFVPTVTGKGLADAPAFVKAPGGAAANIAVGLVRLGASSAFVGKVGEDPFGHFLADTLAGEGVDVRALRFETKARTALAFVSLRPDGEREFLFYRHPSADMLFRPDEVDAGTIAVLAGLLAHDRFPDQDALAGICRFANVVGALATTERGAIPALPTRAAVEARLAEPPAGRER